MRRWRSAFGLGLVVALAASVALTAQQKIDKKQEEALRKELDSINVLIADAAAGRMAPNDFGAKWIREDYMKAGDKKEFVPFIVTLDPKATGSLTMYWRVVSQGWMPPAESTDKKDDKNKKTAVPSYPWQSISNVTAGANTPFIARSFQVPAGTYDVYVVLKEPASTQKNAPMPKASVLKHTVTVPDFWNGELATSSVMIAQRIDPLPAPLTPEQTTDRPYAALGGMELVPRLDTKYAKKDELQPYMLVYNPKPDAMNKPNITVEFNFCQIAPGNQPKEGEPCKAGEKFFNKTMPQNFNAETLDPRFDLSMGHQIQIGQAIPLASFPEGDYRLEIKVTDKLANKTVTKDVPFSVAAS